MRQAEEILEAALKLDPGDRAHLVAELSASLEGVQLGEAWDDEIQRRIDDIESGRVQPVPGEEVFVRLEQRFGGR
ncbi:MAG: addiction module protein [Polyangiaceae bacterium]|nr:addiction module protein [Polyangiaceae bacterium]